MRPTHRVLGWLLPALVLACALWSVYAYVTRPQQRSILPRAAVEWMPR